MADAGVVAGPIATQLVQYSNDAVDVYYSDGCRLQLSACGTAFRYYHPPSAGQHPLHGQREIQQRTEFATSEFRLKVTEAIEFRNRFAERPFLCRGLLSDTSIVRLHADITEVAWPSELSAGDVTVLPDGAVRLVSADEYASVTMAPHRQYFTTEVLSRVSQRRQPRAGHHTAHEQRSTTGAGVRQEPQACNGSSPRDEMPSPIPSVPPSRVASRISADDSLHNHPAPSTVSLHATPCTSDPGFEPQPGLSSLSETSVLQRESVRNPETEDKWEYVWMAQHHSLIDYPPCWSHAVVLLQAFHQKMDIQSSALGGEGTNNNDNKNTQLQTSTVADIIAPIAPKEVQIESVSLNPSFLQHCPQATLLPNSSQPTSSLVPDRRPPGESVLSATERRAVTLQRLLKKDFAGCVFVAPPCSLPVNCPFLHLHRWRPAVIASEDNDQAEAAYMYGKVKVICTQGVIYKLVWRSPRCVEIYPGDGSLMRSTGLSGHFFSHYRHSPSKGEERTYSTQSPPPTLPGTAYCVAKLITRAARFLKHLCEESLHSLISDDPCCWAVRLAECEPVEPLPTVLLEDSAVQAVGHFTAFSNGHVRILFNDRTSLDMVCDFSKRVLHGADAQTAKRYTKRPAPLGLSAGVARLLLRTGHYQNVDVNHPDSYEQYVEAALHWADWVNSSPTERCHFYKDTIYDQDRQRSIESELTKIKCFNFIVDNVVKHPHQKNPSPSAGTNYGLGCDIANPGHASHVTSGIDDHVTAGGDVTRHLTNQSPGSFSMSSIQDVLRKTAEAVADLDRFMKDAAGLEKS